jgi:hypothetical protein
MNAIPIQITCATDRELKSMLNKHSYTNYYRSLIIDEIKRRLNETQ